MDLLVDLTFEAYDLSRREILPAANEREVAKKIIQVGSKIVVNLDPLFDKPLISPLCLGRTALPALLDRVREQRLQRGLQPEQEVS